MNQVDPKDRKDFDNPYKIALIAMHDGPDDLHMCLVSSLCSKGDDQMMFGEFVRGISKKLIYDDPRTGFLIMSVSRDFWTGSMDFTHFVTEGEDYVHMNEYPLFRFNTYFGVSEVHYADLKEISARKALNMPGVIANAVRVMALKAFNAGDKTKTVLRPWATKFLSGLVTLKFIAYTGEDGYPKIVPVIQAQTASSGRLVFTKAPYSAMLADLKDGARVNVYGMSLEMEVVLVKGNYHKGRAGLGYVEIDKVYNCAPPKPGYVYPDLSNKAVDFADEPLAEQWI